ncbi:uncharacterized protein LOC135489898 [Lineus longissimus]|uniref:uncharacterized protein LOC135489898 n=1 Tax=Lineus longissimus TaxID=88925 RepID=UPI002B4C64C0
MSGKRRIYRMSSRSGVNENFDELTQLLLDLKELQAEQGKEVSVKKETEKAKAEKVRTNTLKGLRKRPASTEDENEPKPGPSTESGPSPKMRKKPKDVTLMYLEKSAKMS